VATYLEELLDAARSRVAAAREREPLETLRDRALDARAPASFAEALSGPGVAVIAEVKRASPSRGSFAPDLDAATQARAYRDGGAAAISVLTEPTRFAGHLDDLAAVVGDGVPALRKDFIVDPYQVWETCALGASAVLLIVAALDDSELETLLATCDEATVDALVEVHDEDEAERARAAGASIVGINARDLTTFELDRGAFARLRPTLPGGGFAVGESGAPRPPPRRAPALAGRPPPPPGWVQPLHTHPTACSSGAGFRIQLVETRWHRLTKHRLRMEPSSVWSQVVGRRSPTHRSHRECLRSRSGRAIVFLSGAASADRWSVTGRQFPSMMARFTNLSPTHGARSHRAHFRRATTQQMSGWAIRFSFAEAKSN
jgi:indole-3-glycerol phosphate synthase